MLTMSKKRKDKPKIKIEIIIKNPKSCKIFSRFYMKKLIMF